MYIRFNFEIMQYKIGEKIMRYAQAFKVYAQTLGFHSLNVYEDLIWQLDESENDFRIRE